MTSKPTLELAVQRPLNARGAVFSDCGHYRYWLERWWAYGVNPMVFVMCNPSDADAFRDDHTVRRCMAFARSHDKGGIIVVNALAYRATDPATLPPLVIARGPENGHYLEKAAGMGDPVFAWGKRMRGYEDAYLSAYHIFMTSKRYCLGMTVDGDPRHPARLSKAARISPWELNF